MKEVIEVEAALRLALEALEKMEARFGDTTFRHEIQPSTYGCHHISETCPLCEGLVTGWKAVRAANQAITFIKAALEAHKALMSQSDGAQPEQEPAAKVDSRFDSQVVWYLDQLPKDGTKLYTHPPVPYVVEPRDASTKLTAQPKEQKQRPFTKKQRDTLCTVYAIASASTTANSLPNIAKIVNQLLTEDLEVQPKEPEHSAPHGEPVAVYGYCPECGAQGVARERRPDGNDRCANGHTYPSRAATPPQRKPTTELRSKT